MQAAGSSGTVINQDGYQTIKHGGLATGTIVNTGAEGGPDSENVSTGQMVGGLLNPPPSTKMPAGYLVFGDGTGHPHLRRW